MEALLDFTGRDVLVVGGSSGIGNGIAQAFRGRGANVHVWGTRPSAEAYSTAVGSDLDGLQYACVDVTSSEALQAQLLAFDALDVLILSQGTNILGGGEFELDGWDHVMAVNLRSLLSCATAFKPHLERSSGNLIIVSSVSAFRGNKGIPAYAASKAGALSLTKSLAAAWAAHGIRVNGIAPGLVETNLTKPITQDGPRLAAKLNAVPLGRTGLPSEMAAAALFLASPLASYIVGHTIVVDGGLMLS